MAEIVLEHVSKSYPDGATAVRDLNITIADGEFVILVGPSGRGASRKSEREAVAGASRMVSAWGACTTSPWPIG